MRYLLPLLLIASLLLTLGETRRKKDTLNQQAPTKEQRASVVESNHFQSEQETSTQFEVTDIQTDKPLAFLLQPNNAQQQANITIVDNPIDVTITSGNDKKSCHFESYYGLCSIPTVSQKAQIKVQCKTAPCEIRWKVIQPQTVQIDGNHTLNHLVSVNQQKNHAILKAYCSNPELKQDFANSIDLYTNSLYEKIITTQGEVVYLFNNQAKGQYYMTTSNSAIQQCAIVTLQHATENIQLTDSGTLITDFISSQEDNIYQIISVLSTDLMVEFSAHDAAMNNLNNDTGLTIELIGFKNKKQTKLSELTLYVDDQKQYIDFSSVFKKPAQKYDKLQLHIKGITQKYLITSLRFTASNKPMVQFGEQSYFDLKKGEKINYQLVPLQSEVTNINKMNIFISDTKAFKLSKDSCPKEGCQFTIQALDNAKGHIYIGEDVKKQKAAEIVLQEFKKSIKAKLKQGEQRFYSYKIKANTAVQMLINSPNVIVYAADKLKCQPKSLSTCYEKQFNFHNPSIYQAKTDTQIGFKVIALDTCQFVLTILTSDNPYITLKDTQPFVYLMDDSQHQILFRFKLNQKQDVSFNLIAPLNQLTLAVYNKETLDKESTKKDSTEAELSLDGYVSYSKADLKSQFFVIKIQKREEYKKKFVHFTLIASTKQSNLRLQSGNAHYQTLKPKASRDYVFSFIPNKNIFVNFYTHNIDKNLNLQAVLSSTDSYNNKSNTANFTIGRQTDAINVALSAEKLCASQAGECQLFLRLLNNMGVEADVTITLMVSEAIIELKDGIWQNYDINQAASTAHFYFLPKHEKHSITLFYHSSNVDLKIIYKLWKTDDTSIDISKWPFPSEFKDTKSTVSPQSFKPTRFIHIENTQLKTCWPNCVVLLSIIPDQKELEELEQKPIPFFNINHEFKIMASNNLIEIPQKNKLDIILNKAQQKYLLVDLKYYLQKESIVFFNYITMGSVELKGNVYSQRNPRCPNTEQIDSDFQFIGIETEIEMETIKKKLEENNMQKDKNPYICILAYSFVESKFSIEFISEVNDIKNIPIDTTTAVTMKPSEIRLFQLNAHFQYFLKISRTSGFPYISKKICNPTSDMQKCLQDFKSSDEKGEQLVNKIMVISETPCQSCMLYVKIESAQATELSLHHQSRYVQTELKESTPFADILAPSEINRYTLTGTKNKEIIINIQILSGDIKVAISNFGFVPIMKQNAKGVNNIHIVIPSKDLNSSKNDQGTSLINAFGLSSFIQLHAIVQPQNPKQSANYIISYSNGEATTYLEDGLISQYTLVSKKTSKFLYNNPTPSAGLHLHLSTPDTQTLNNIHTKIYALDDMNDEDTKVQITPSKPDFKKKTVNPTMMLHLPSKLHYIIQVQNSNGKDVVLSIGVNNREIIYLPFNHQFPFRLQINQYLYFVLSTSSPGYVKLTLSKCDSSQPFIAFTDNYKDFVGQNFQTEEQISENLIYQNVIKVKKAGGLYLKVKAGANTNSILTVKATFSPTKIENTKAKAGNKGNIQYQLLDSTKADIKYSAVVCDNNCKGTFSYSAISSNNIDKIIAQLVCTSVSFDLLGFTQKEQPNIQPITVSKSTDNQIVFTHALKQDIEYIGIKAVNSNSGAVVYYPPVELATFTGKVNLAIAVASKQNNLIWIFSVLILISLCGCLIAYRRFKKRHEYRPLTEVQDTIDQD